MADVRAQIIQAAIEAANGEFSEEDLRRVDGSLEQAGMTSLAFLQFVSLLEQRFGITIGEDVAPDVLMNVSSVKEFIDHAAG